jgi:hypothetical protein
MGNTLGLNIKYENYQSKLSFYSIFYVNVNAEKRKSRAQAYASFQANSV